MEVTSTNISTPTTFNWNGKNISTGINKLPTSKPIFLSTFDVKNDSVVDRKNHGGVFKACYLFSENHYDYWKELYPNLNWNWGMFGENLTISGLNEDNLYIGDIYKVGEALIQVTQPREPCFKFGYKFGSQKAIKQFIDYGYSGTYVRVLEEGYVSKGDTFQLIKQAKDSITTAQFFNLLFTKNKDKKLIKAIINNNSLPLRKREKLKTFL